MKVMSSSRLLTIFYITYHLCLSDAIFFGHEPNMLANRIYVGCYSQPDGIGIGIAVLAQNATTNQFEYVSTIKSVSPSALAMDHGKKWLYSVNELHGFEGEIGFVSSYKIPWSQAGLTFANNQSSLGSLPNFITLDPSGRFLLIANYRSGNVVVYRLQDGQIKDVTHDLRGYGHNAHQVVFNPKGTMVAIPFLGSDLVHFFTFDKERGVLNPYTVFLKNNIQVHLSAVVRKGSGARHLVYSKDGRYFYVIGELLSTVTVFRAVVDEDIGQYTAIQEVTLIPEGYIGRRWAAAIVVHPNGRFLYASERGINHIAIFKINSLDGTLDLFKFQNCGRTPRHMVVGLYGSKQLQLFVTNEGDNAIQVFEIDKNGSLDLDYTIVGINSPTYLQFWP